MTIQNILKNIESQISQLNNSIVKSYEDLDKEISIKESILQNTLGEYLELTNILQITRKETDNLKRDITERENKLREDTIIYNKNNEQLNLEKVRLFDIKEQIEAAEEFYSNTVKRINEKNKEIVLVQDKLNDLIVELEKERKNLNTINEEILNAEAERSIDNDKFYKELEKAKQDKIDFEESTIKDREFIKERMDFIDNKEKEILTKEETFKILEQRYIKLFGDKGISVKV